MTKEELYRKLWLELNKYTSQLSNLGIGVGLVQRAFLSPSVNQVIDENESNLTFESIKELLLEITSRYLIMVRLNNHFFDFVVANQVPRTLFNMGLEDEDPILTKWCSFGRPTYWWEPTERWSGDITEFPELHEKMMELMEEVDKPLW